MSEINRVWRLRKRPVGDITNDVLSLEEERIPEPGDNEFLFRLNYLSLDPTNRIWMSDMDQYPGFPFCPPDQGLCTPTRLSARQISSSHVVPLPAEAALDVEPTRAPAFRAVLRHRSTLVPFLRQAASLHSSRVSLPGQVAPRSSAACRRTAAGSDALPPGGASSTLRASPAGPRSSPAAAGDS